MRGPISTLPRTVCHGKSVGCWKTMPRSAPGPWTGSPLTSTSPVVGVKKPAIILRMVVLPHPDGPTSMTNSPGSTVRSMSATRDRRLLAADERSA